MVVGTSNFLYEDEDVSWNPQKPLGHSVYLEMGGGGRRGRRSQERKLLG